VDRPSSPHPEASPPCGPLVRADERHSAAHSWSSSRAVRPGAHALPGYAGDDGTRSADAMTAPLHAGRPPSAQWRRCAQSRPRRADRRGGGCGAHRCLVAVHTVHGSVRRCNGNGDPSAVSVGPSRGPNAPPPDIGEHRTNRPAGRPSGAVDGHSGAAAPRAVAPRGMERASHPRNASHRPSRHRGARGLPGGPVGTTTTNARPERVRRHGRTGRREVTPLDAAMKGGQPG